MMEALAFSIMWIVGCFLVVFGIITISFILALPRLFAGDNWDAITVIVVTPTFTFCWYHIVIWWLEPPYEFNFIMYNG
jgi:hypothetical protein